MRVWYVHTYNSIAQQFCVLNWLMSVASAVWWRTQVIAPVAYVC